MGLLKFLLCLFAFIGALAAAGALVISVLLMLRFPPLLVAVVLACWILSRLLKALRRKDQVEASTAPQ
jgi:membrane protein implicated in regulation of membrane protease activity